MNETYKKEILTSALEGRIREVTEYQVNIDNFKLAIELIGDREDLQDFKSQIESLLSSNTHELGKAQIMLEVIQSQME